VTIRRVLVTGGAGFLGRAIVASAETHGYEVLAPRKTEFDLVTGAGTDEYLRTATRERPVDVIIHSAAYYGGIGLNEEQPATIFDQNARMTLTVFECARRFGVGKVLPIGSACAYPGYLNGVLREDQFWDGPLHDSVEAYGFSKKLQLVAQRAYFKQFGIQGNHLILANLYGPHDVFCERRSHVLAALIKKFVEGTDEVRLWGDGSPIREFLYVDDAAEAIVRAVALEHDLIPINIGTGVGTAIKDLAGLISRIVGFTGRISWDTSRPNGCRLKVLDIHRAATRLQWTPQCNLEDGLRRTIDWYQSNKATADLRV
jgi:GDP-L-fucose synthase